MGRTDLPEQWESIALGDKRVCLDIQPGFACGKKDTHGGIPHLRMNNISSDGQINFSLVRRIPKENAEKTNKWLEPGDVIFCNTNSTELVGKSCRFSGWEEKCTFSNHLTRLRANPKQIMSEWLLISLRQLWLQGFFATNCTEFIGQSAFNKDKLCEVEIPIPPLPEQRRIVARIEELTKRLNHARILQKESSLAADNILLTAMNNCFNSENGYDHKSIRSIVAPKEMWNFSKNPRAIIQYIDISAVNNIDGRIIAARQIEGSNAPSRAKKIVRAGDVIFATTRPYLKNIAVVPSDLDGEICSTGFCVLRPNQQCVITDYLFFLCRSDLVIEQVIPNQEKSTYPAVSDNEVLDAQVPVPSLPEQHRIVDYLNGLRDKTDQLKKHQAEVDAELGSFLPALLAKAFRGEL